MDPVRAEGCAKPAARSRLREAPVEVRTAIRQHIAIPFTLRQACTEPVEVLSANVARPHKKTVNKL